MIHPERRASKARVPASGAGTDHTQVDVQSVTLGNLSGVEEHVAVPPGSYRTEA